MSGKLVIRRDDGTVETVSVTGPIRIGSAQQSQVRLEGDGVLPHHADAGFEGGEYWIRDAGNAGVAINGERAVEKRTLRHLDVITVGSGVHVIFSTTAASLPAQPRSKRPLPPPPAVAPAPKKMTVVVKPEAAPPAFQPADAGEGSNTILGPVPGVMPAFQPAGADADPGNTIRGPVPGVTPTFQPVAELDSPNTIMGQAAPGITPKFQPAEAEPGSSPNTIFAAAVPGAQPKFDPANQSIETAIPNTIFEPAKPGAVPKFEAGATLETVAQAAAAPPKPTVARPRVPAADRPITGVTLRGISGVLTAPLGRSVIGRAAAATIRIDSDEVSKVHAFLDVTVSEVTLTDQKSVNGTTVNGSPSSGPRRLIEGDRVAFATFEFRVEFVRMDGSA